MNKFASSIFAKPVILAEERAIVGFVEEIVIDPANGNLVGFIIREGFGKKHLKALAAKDVLGVADNFILVKGLSVLGELDEIVRIKKILDQNIKIIGNKVVTVSGKHLGKVKDFTLFVELGKISRLYVARGVLAAVKSDLIISLSQIVAIEKDRIVVEDAVIKGGKGVRAIGAAPEGI